MLPRGKKGQIVFHGQTACSGPTVKEKGMKNIGGFQLSGIHQLLFGLYVTIRQPPSGFSTADGVSSFSLPSRSPSTINHIQPLFNPCGVVKTLKPITTDFVGGHSSSTPAGLSYHLYLVF